MGGVHVGKDMNDDTYLNMNVEKTLILLAKQHDKHVVHVLSYEEL